MEEGGNFQTLRTLSQIETEMQQAEVNYAEAESRLREARARLMDVEQRVNEAMRDRDAALEVLDNYQSEIDFTVALLRKCSPVGSKWKSEHENVQEAMIFDQMTNGAGKNRPAFLVNE